MAICYPHGIAKSQMIVAAVAYDLYQLSRNERIENPRLAISGGLKKLKIEGL